MTERTSHGAGAAGGASAPGTTGRTPTAPRPSGASADRPGDLTEALAAAAAASTLLVALDFDGTLAPFTEDPADSRPLPEAQEALDVLAQLPRTTVAVVSGRPLEFLRTVVDPRRRMVLSGSHGAEVDLTAAGGAGGVDISLSGPQLDLLERAVAATEAVARRYPGSLTERKPAGVALHTRPVEDPELAELALAEVAAAYSALPGLRVTPGQQVVESSVLSATKGDGLAVIRGAVHPDVTVFAGDDVTDEDALAVLGPRDVGIKVGDKETVAPWRVADPAAFTATLATLARLRARTVQPGTVGGPGTAAPIAAGPAGDTD
ncbi:trehalose-phosphatase [Kocuria sp.]|uniref:trehalose-phosphatase n=1 Tax=Kocuria sp. TaxID=1871328 RepID=UPI0026DB830F|nr:trehalose-phosphatase [Kocuria sp.]MDO4919273.1 trehalose-phosphatase [Kocuria sp.]